MIVPLISDPCCISIPTEVLAVVDISGVRGAGGTEIIRAYIIHYYLE